MSLHRSGSDAATKDIQRGTIFTVSTQLTASNYQSLLANDSFTLNLADYNAGEQHLTIKQSL
jgi:hypothetical protein